MVALGRILIGLLSLVPAGAHATARLQLSLENSATSLGQPVQAELRLRDSQQVLSRIDFTRWEDHFGVRVDEYETRRDASQNGTAEQILSLSLYPRRTGKLSLPSLHFDGARTIARTIEVDVARAEGRSLTVSTTVEPRQAWERQQILIGVEVTTPERFASLRPGELSLPGFEVIPVPPTREWTGEGDQRAAVLRTGWALFPLTAGPARIDLPPVAYYRGGAEQRVFYLPPQQIQVRPLPPYVPPLMPVGRVTIDSTIQPETLLATHSLAYWNITLQGRALTPYQLPAIRRQVESNPDIEILPIESEHQSAPDISGVHGRVIHRIPFKATTNGLLQLPRLELQYFDPDSGRVVNVSHDPQTPLVLGWVVRTLMGIAAAILTVLVTRWIGIRIHSAWLRRKKRRQAVAALQQAQKPNDLRTALALTAEAEGWPTNLSISEWARRWQARYQTSPAFGQTVERLQNHCYGPALHEDIEPLRNQLQSLVSNRRRHPKIRGQFTNFHTLSRRHTAAPSTPRNVR